MASLPVTRRTKRSWALAEWKGSAKAEASHSQAPSANLSSVGHGPSMKSHPGGEEEAQPGLGNRPCGSGC